LYLPIGLITFNRLYEYGLGTDAVYIKHYFSPLKRKIPYKDINKIEQIYNPPGGVRARLPRSFLVRIHYNDGIETIYFYNVYQANDFADSLSQFTQKQVIENNSGKEKFGFFFDFKSK
jgi:hypothetical protein